MRGESHQCLGHFLAREYLDQVSRMKIRAFLIGCIEPDRNPMTYFKGSIRSQWLRGHNWGNARRYIRRVAFRLEHRKTLHFLDYYTLGKLIHYVTDAFTHAHNERFGPNLREHCLYEQDLQRYFLDFMAGSPVPQIRPGVSVMDTIYRFHDDYLIRPGTKETDSQFTLSACCSVLSLLFPRPAAAL